MDKIIIRGRRWFQKSAGNTYHSVTVTMPDGTELNSGIHYGYDSAYTQTATAMIYKQLGEEKTGSDINAFYNLRQRFEIDYTADNVTRKRDL
jgi:hypothetical protein